MLLCIFYIDGCMEYDTGNGPNEIEVSFCPPFDLTLASFVISVDEFKAELKEAEKLGLRMHTIRC